MKSVVIYLLVLMLCADIALAGTGTFSGDSITLGDSTVGDFFSISGTTSDRRFNFCYDCTNNGTMSAVFGHDVHILTGPRGHASGIAAGDGITVTETRGAAFGWETILSGYAGLVSGWGSVCSGDIAAAFIHSTASGVYAFSVGYDTIASGGLSTVFGQGLEVSGDYSFGIALDDLTGTNVTQDNTFYVGGGRTGFNTTTPSTTVEVNGTLTVNDILNLTPRATAPASPDEGFIYCNSTDHRFYGYNGTAWQTFSME